MKQNERSPTGFKLHLVISTSQFEKNTAIIIIFLAHFSSWWCTARPSLAINKRLSSSEEVSWTKPGHMEGQTDTVIPVDPPLLPSTHQLCYGCVMIRCSIHNLFTPSQWRERRKHCRESLSLSINCIELCMHQVSRYWTRRALAWQFWEYLSVCVPQLKSLRFTLCWRRRQHFQLGMISPLCQLS